MSQRSKITIIKVAFKNLQHQRFRTLILFILLVVTTVALFLGDFLTQSMSEGISETGKRIGADVIVVPDTFVSSVEDALFSGKACTVNFDRKWLDNMRAIEGVEKVSSQLYISSLSSECCDEAMQLIAIDIKTDFTIAPWLSKDGITSLNPDEIILGSNMKKKIGDTVKYFGRVFTVVDVLDESGMGYDSSAFISYEAAYEIANDPIYQSVIPFRGDSQVISMVLLDVKEGYSLEEVKNNIEKKYLDQDIAIYKTSELMSGFADSLDNIKIYGTILKILFVLMAVTSLYAIFSMTIYLRRHEFGSMLSVGVTKGQIIQMLVIEMLGIVILASVVGVVAVSAVIIPFHAQLKNLFTVPYLLPNVGIIVTMGIKTLVSNVIVSGIASFQSFWKFSKLEAAELIKEEN